MMWLCIHRPNVKPGLYSTITFTRRLTAPTAQVYRWATTTHTCTHLIFCYQDDPHTSCFLSLSLPLVLSSLLPWILLDLYSARRRKVDCIVFLIQKVRSSLLNTPIHTQIQYKYCTHISELPGHFLLTANVLEQQEATDEPQQKLDVLYEEGNTLIDSSCHFFRVYSAISALYYFKIH